VRNMGLGLLVGLLLLIPAAAKAVTGVQGANTTDGGCTTTVWESALPGQDIVCQTAAITVCTTGGSSVSKGPLHICSWVCLASSVPPGEPPCTGE